MINSSNEFFQIINLYSSSSICGKCGKQRKVIVVIDEKKNKIVEKELLMLINSN